MFEFGDGSGTPVSVRFASRAAMARMMLHPELRLGEAYMNGDLVLERGTIADLLSLLLSQQHSDKLPFMARPQAMLRYSRRRIDQYNYRHRARRNVAHHYDLDGRLYSLFLDSDRQYSCAYFESPDQSLDDAQLAKKRHLAAKLLIEATASARSTSAAAGAGSGSISPSICGAQVTGVTLSEEQFKLARGRAAERQSVGSRGFSPAGLPRPERDASTASCRSACSSMSASAISANSSGNAPVCSPMTA